MTRSCGARFAIGVGLFYGTVNFDNVLGREPLRHVDSSSAFSRFLQQQPSHVETSSRGSEEGFDEMLEPGLTSGFDPLRPRPRPALRWRQKGINIILSRARLVATAWSAAW